MGYVERVADDKDPLRSMLRAARSWHVPPTVVLKLRTVNTTEWTEQDIDLLLILEDYEAGLCQGCRDQLSETTKPEHADAYRPSEHIRCHRCRAEALVADVMEKKYEHDSAGTAGLMVPLVLDPEVVALNRLPVPELPPELQVP